MVGHPGDIDVRFELRFLAQLEGAPGDGGGFVADPFEVLADLQGHRDQPELAGHGGFGKQLDGGRQFHLELIEDESVRALTRSARSSSRSTRALMAG
jgi:predicted ATPase